MCLAPVVHAEPREAQVAGSFYPADPTELRQTITAALNHHAEPTSSRKPRILILPHAGYRYSGVVAARGFRELQGRAYDGVVVVGFTHRLSFAGASVDDRDAYATPLGSIPIDGDAAAFLRAQPGFLHEEQAHGSGEHSLEVMLPFLQVVLPGVRVVPIVMGGAGLTDAEHVARALSGLASRGDYLFMFSTDLSHYHPYEQARQFDERTINAMLDETPQAVARLFDGGALEACGRGPILSSLLLAKRLGYPERRLLLYANSGDTTGETERGVVGYAALAMYDASSVITGGMSGAAGRLLVQAARQALNRHFKLSEAPVVDLASAPELQHARGMFVTLRRADGQLRGCIGRIVSDVPLAVLLPTVTLEAALHDSRFSPVTDEEVNTLVLDVSVLTPPRAIADAREIMPGRDGVVLRKDGRGGVFLPQVWDETGWTRVEFLRELSTQKAGLDPDAWQAAELSVFQAQVFEEPAAGGVTAH